MKVGIIGNYGHRNLGDEALLLGALLCATDGGGIEEADIVVFSDDAEDTKSRLRGAGVAVSQLRRPLAGRVGRLPLIFADVFHALRGLDWVIFGGGGLINDSNRTAVPLYALICLFARLRGARIAWWSVGLGPLNSRLHRWLARQILASSHYVTVRDRYSAAIVSELVGRKAQIAPDLAHALQAPLRMKPDIRTVAISVIPFRKSGKWFEQDDHAYSVYCGKILRIVQSVLARHPNVLVRLFPISVGQDPAAIEDLVAKGELAKDPRVIVGAADSVDKLLEQLAEASVVIATRLHAAVLATVARTPVVAISYQPKVTSYVSELNAGYPCFDIQSFDPEAVVEMVDVVLREKDTNNDDLLATNEIRRKELMASTANWRGML